MNVTCPNCATIYRVDPAKVPEAGVRARCNVCSAVFAVGRDTGPAPIRSAASEPPAVQQPRPEPPRPEPPRPSPPAAGPRPSAPAAPSGIPPRPAAPPGLPPRPVAPQRPVSPPAPAAAGAPSPPLTPPAAAVPPAPSMPPAAPRAPAASPAAPAAPRPVSPPAGAPAVATPPRPAAGGAATGRPTNPFLSQDPALKARRLARALISDMVVYHPGKRQEGLRDGNLKELFEEEIKKSWEEYAEQVGREVAESTAYFREALNEILAGGRPIF
jgi:predicted Zn finger-like uncharacterized protein